MQHDDTPQTIRVLGMPVTAFCSYRHAVEYIVQRVKARQKTSCVAITPEKIIMARADESLRSIINQADLRCCDGVGAALAARILSGHVISRVTGVQLFLELIAAAEEQHLRVFLLGARPEANKLARIRLLEKHPLLRIVGSCNGYFNDDESVLEAINAAHADMVFVAMGSPKQERWIAQYRHRITAPYCMGIGGTLDVVSGQAKWAPTFFRRTGTEFLFRLVVEPRRWRRYGIVPKFVLLVLREMMFPRFSGDECL